MGIPIGGKEMFKVFAYDKNDKLIAEYLFEKIGDAIAFQVGMREKGHATHLQRM